MHTQSEFKQLQNIASTMVDERCDHAELTQALEAFAALCSSVTYIEPSPTFFANSGDTELAQGVAINPEAAAQCVKDYQRSIQFIRGTFAAISKKLNETNGSVDLLYAGCGPYATQILPLLTLLPADRLNISLLDIHPESLESVQQLLDYFGLTQFNIFYVCDDACEYRHASLLDIVIAEVMQKALEQEPQVMVTANFSNQMKPGGCLIPNLVQVEIWLANLKQEQQHNKGLSLPAISSTPYSDNRQFIGSVFELNINTIQDVIQEQGVFEQEQISYLSLDNCKLPEPGPGSLPDRVLVTRIQVFEDHWLKDYESDLCLPITVPELSDAAVNQEMSVKYQLGRYPIFMFKAID